MTQASNHFKMRRPCVKCGCLDGRIESRNHQDCVFCLDCGAFQYNAPRTETGKEQRTVSTVHENVKPSVRSEILARDGFACIFCHKRDRDLHIGHILSVKSALELEKSGWLTRPFTDEMINSTENLAAMCEECNLGLGRETVPLYLIIGIFLDRIARRRSQT